MILRGSGASAPLNVPDISKKTHTFLHHFIMLECAKAHVQQSRILFFCGRRPSDHPLCGEEEMKMRRGLGEPMGKGRKRADEGEWKRKGRYDKGKVEGAPLNNNLRLHHCSFLSVFVRKFS